MPNLIVGHVTGNSARIWVRANQKEPFAHLSYRAVGKSNTKSKRLELENRHDFTGVIDITGLRPSTRYECELKLAPSANTAEESRNQPEGSQGTFRTAPVAGGNEVSFLFGSCNLHSLGIFSNPDPAYRRIGQLIEEFDIDFMLHVGDQIYYDVPFPQKPPHIGEYRDKYHDAWGDSKPTRKVLGMLPNYMMLDDHEIVNNFANNRPHPFGPMEFVRDVALKVYREFQFIHSPRTYGIDSLYYHFNYGKYRFFALDTRSERYIAKDGKAGEMIGPQQMKRFQAWLKKNKEAVKFVVTSVPFVGEVRKSEDKWCGEDFNGQREVLIEFLVRNGIGKLVFLTGDMHNSYHASMKVRTEKGDELVIHELMSSPINQLGKKKIDAYVTPKKRVIKNTGTTYTSKIDPRTFYGGHSNIVRVHAKGNTVTFQIQRTKRKKVGVSARSFIP